MALNANVDSLSKEFRSCSRGRIKPKVLPESPFYAYRWEGPYSKHDLRKKIDLDDGLLIGSPTFNRDAIPPVWELLAKVSAIVNKDKPAAAFGSYGRSGEAVKFIEQRLHQLRQTDEESRLK